MFASQVRSLPTGGAAELIATLVAAEGTTAQNHPRSSAFSHGVDVTRNLADALHYLCVLHGRQPDLIALAALRHPADPAGAFLDRADDGFATERGYLARLVVAAGPQPSTPGAADCEGAVVGQHHALAMLARSDRSGTAFGAAAAMLIDWLSIRPLLDQAAVRLGVPLSPCRLPDMGETRTAIDALCTSPAIERAVTFGAQQFLLQQRGLWLLLEAREIARRHA